ncbi:MAG TPA: hypothetical protein DIC23_00235 [Planctomycetaceae bacterium]|mgnify:CR=1 FL=1|nr:hypothetical protein [Planctomycetaceae bacterium]
MKSEALTQRRHRDAFAAYSSGKLSDGMKLVQQCLETDPDDGRAWELGGLIHYAEQRFQESVNSIEHASALVPLRAVGQACLGHAYAKTNRPRLALNLLSELIENESVSAGLMLQIATGLDAVGRPDLAIQACRRAVDQNPNLAQAHYDLGYYGGKVGVSFSQIESSIRRAINLAPHHSTYRVGLAGLLSENGQAEEAHGLVARLTNHDLTSLNCSCCLQRLVTLYRSAKDTRRVVVCQQQLLHLATR